MSGLNAKPVSYLAITRVNGKSTTRLQRRCPSLSAAENNIRRRAQKLADGDRVVFWIYGPADPVVGGRPLIDHGFAYPDGSTLPA